MLFDHSLELTAGHWAVIFISERQDDPAGYAGMDEATMSAVSELPGFIGWESVRQSPVGIFISYWKDLDSINIWRTDSLHREAKEQGRRTWYSAYRSLVCRIEEAHHFVREDGNR